MPIDQAATRGQLLLCLYLPMWRCLLQSWHAFTLAALGNATFFSQHFPSITGLFHSLGSPCFRRFAVEWMLEISTGNNLYLPSISFLKEGRLTFSMESFYSASCHLVLSWTDCPKACLSETEGGKFQGRTPSFSLVSPVFNNTSKATVTSSGW